MISDEKLLFDCFVEDKSQIRTRLIHSVIGCAFLQKQHPTDTSEISIDTDGLATAGWFEGRTTQSGLDLGFGKVRILSGLTIGEGVFASALGAKFTAEGE